MIKERLTTIWSLYRRAPILLCVYFRTEGRIVCIERVEELGL
jgi:hypothetical protein